jgi:hypothetical protein
LQSRADERIEFARTLKNRKAQRHDPDAEKKDVDDLADAEEMGAHPYNEGAANYSYGLWLSDHQISSVALMTART